MTKKAWENHPGKKNITPPFQQIVNMMHCRKRNLFRQLFRRRCHGVKVQMSCSRPRVKNCPAQTGNEKLEQK